MATTNPFDLLGDDDNDDPSQLIAKVALAAPTTTAPPPQQQPKQQAKLPSKPLPPAQAVRESKSDGREGGRGGGRAFGRGRGGHNREPRDSGNNENTFSNNVVAGGYGGAANEGELDKTERRGGGYGGPRGSFRGGRRGGFNNGDTPEGERPRRVFERRSGTGRGNEFKREGAGRGNWGTNTDEIAQETEELVSGNEKIVVTEKQPGEEEAGEVNKETPVTEPKEEEPENKEMTLEEYEKVLEEKRKALQALKTEERKVELDKEFESMQLISSKKTNNEIFAKLGSDKDKRKEADKEEKSKKPVSINEFLKPAEGGKYYSPGGRGRGRGRGPRGGAFAGGNTISAAAPSIEDPGQFPTLGAK